MIQKIADFISDNPYVIIIIFVLTIVGFILTAIGTLRKNKAKLLFTVDTTDLINNELIKNNDLEILFRKERIQQLSVSKLKIYNGGNIPVQNSMFYDGHELILKEVSGGKILKVDIVTQSSDTIKAVMNGNMIQFDTFEEKESIELLVYHSNDNDVTSILTVSGKIRNGKLSQNIITPQLIDRAIEISNANSLTSMLFKAFLKI